MDLADGFMIFCLNLLPPLSGLVGRILSKFLANSIRIFGEYLVNPRRFLGEILCEFLLNSGRILGKISANSFAGYCSNRWFVIFVLKLPPPPPSGLVR
jgi:hypothetical protein